MNCNAPLCAGADAKSKCAGCGTVVYCNADCQKNDWKQHKGICKESRAKAKAALEAVLTEPADAEQLAKEEEENAKKKKKKKKKNNWYQSQQRDVERAQF